MFRQLSFDTSNTDVHLALFEDDVLVREQVISVKDAASGTARQEASNLLVPGIDSLIRDAGWNKSELDCLIVGTGPGGFTGIRTAVVTARALAQALQLPLFPVSILECIASALPGDFAIVLYATMGHFFLAKGNARGVNCTYAATKEIAEFLGGTVEVYADERAWAELSQANERGDSLPVTLKAVPHLPNIAVQQARFAWQGLALKVNDICERLNQRDVHAGTESSKDRLDFHQALCRELPYDVVVPTYLRAPSVTLKKTNV